MSEYISPLPLVSLKRRPVQIVRNYAKSHIIGYVAQVSDILNPEEFPNWLIISKVTTLLLKGSQKKGPLIALHNLIFRVHPLDSWILLIGGAAMERVCDQQNYSV